MRTVSNQYAFYIHISSLESNSIVISLQVSGEAYVGITGPAEVELGKSVTYLVALKIPPESTANYELTVSLPEVNGLGLCALRVIEFGSNLPCYDMEPGPFFGPLNGGTSNATVNLPLLGNIGTYVLRQGHNYYFALQ